MGLRPPERGKVRETGPIWRVTTTTAGMRRRVSNYFFLSIRYFTVIIRMRGGGGYTMIAAIQPEEKVSKCVLYVVWL